MSVAQGTGLPELMRRFATDEEFRNRVLLAPKETLMAELGISRETYEALVAVIPVLVAGGLLVAGGKDPSVTSSWGNWGR